MPRIALQSPLPNKELNTGDSAELGITPKALVDGLNTMFTDVYGAQPGVQASMFNFNGGNLLKFRRAAALTRSGGTRGKIVMIGDSMFAGAGSGSSGTSNMNGAAIFAVPQLLHGLGGAPFNLNSNGWWGTQGFDNAAGITLAGYDTRLVPGANWTPNLTSLGGKVIRYATGAVNNWAYTPTYPFDSFSLVHLKNSGNGSMTANVDGGASLGTINTNNASLIWASQTFTGIAKGLHQINLVPNNDGQMFIGGIIAWDSTVPAFDVVGTAVYGAVASTFTPNINVYDAMPALRFLAPDLTVICLTINNSNANTPLAAYLADIQILITNAKVSGDVLIVIGPPSNTTQATDGTLDSYVTGLKGLALTNNCALLDLKARNVSYAAYNAVMPYFDALHLGKTGHYDEANSIFVSLAEL